MEIVTFINDYLFYSYNIISDFISDSSSLEKSHKLLNLFEKHTLLDNKAFIQATFVWKEAFNLKINKEIVQLLNKNLPLSGTYIEYLKKLTSIIENNFVNQGSTKPNVEIASYKLSQNELTLINLLKLTQNKNTTEFISILIFINNFLLDSVKTLHTNERLNWKLTYIYLLLENYMQFLDNSKPTDNDIQEMLLMLQPYLNIKKGNLIPLMFLSKENNIVLDSNPFPDDIHYKNFNSIGIDLDKIDNLYFTNYFHKSFIDNTELSPLFSHEVGHLIDLNFLNLSSTIADDIYKNFYNHITTYKIDFYQWIREMVADSFGVCTLGWAFLFAQMFSINSDNTYTPSKSHPGIYFRLNIIYSYLIQNNFGNLLDPYSLQKVNNNMLDLKNQFNIMSPQHHELENILFKYTNYIYKVTKDFIEGSKYYVSYDNILEIICNNDGNIHKSLQQLNNQENTLRNFIIKQNLQWITRIKTTN